LTRKRATAKLPKTPYWLLSRYYDDLWPRRTKAWISARRGLLGPVLKRARTVCELGCGTGTNSIEFARQGLKVYAVDLSAEMCRAAKEKARRKRVDLTVIQADMRKFRLPEPVDLVASEWGPLNHLRRKADLLVVVKTVARALRPGGYFYFDLHQRHHYERWAEPVVYDHSKFFFAMQGGYRPQSGRGWTETTFFVPRAKGNWSRHSDVLEMVHWSYPEVVLALRQAGFKTIRLFDFHDLNAQPSNTRQKSRSLRTMYLARKALS
jgi:SAM-dependent methyltransferase